MIYDIIPLWYVSIHIDNILYQYVMIRSITVIINININIKILYLYVTIHIYTLCLDMDINGHIVIISYEIFYNIRF